MLDTAAVVVLLAAVKTLTFQHLAIPVPDDYELAAAPGPDFTVYHVHPGGTASRFLGIYLGNYPSAFAPKKDTRQEPFRIGRQDAHWTLWETVERGVTTFHAETMLDRPFGIEPSHATRLHLFIEAETPEALKMLQGLAAKIHPLTGRSP